MASFKRLPSLVRGRLCLDDILGCEVCSFLKRTREGVGLGRRRRWRTVRNGWRENCGWGVMCERIISVV